MPNFKTFRELEKYIEKQTLKAQDEFLETLSVQLPSTIVNQIEKGISPVDGEGRFDKYSTSYSESIKDGRYPGKKLRPVNLKLSGEMLDSIFSEVNKRAGTVYIGFKSKLAKIHTEDGAGKSKTIRKLIPTDGESFNQVIQRLITKLFNKTIKRYFK